MMLADQELRTEMNQKRNFNATEKTYQIWITAGKMFKLCVYGNKGEYIRPLQRPNLLRQPLRL